MHLLLSIVLTHTHIDTCKDIDKYIGDKYIGEEFSYIQILSDFSFFWYFLFFIPKL